MTRKFLSHFLEVLKNTTLEFTIAVVVYFVDFAEKLIFKKVRHFVSFKKNIFDQILYSIFHSKQHLTKEHNVFSFDL